MLITGGAGHLGSAMSEALAAFGANLFIVGTDLNKNRAKAEQLASKYNIFCKSLDFDMRSEEKVRRVVDEIVTDNGNIDVLVNNAVYSCIKPLEDFTYQEWREGIDGTINGVFIVTQTVLKHMLSVRRGNIINIASMYGVVAPNMSIYGNSGQNNPANYGAGKAAIIQFTKYLATVYANQGIRANSISPGAFPNKETQKNTSFIKELCRMNPMERIGQPSDLYGAIVFLASDASSYMTGHNMIIDGGWTTW